MRAKDVMSDGVFSLGWDASVRDATELLVNTGVTAMPVLDQDGVMIGIVSEADLIRRADPEAWHRELSDDGLAAAPANDHSRPVTDIMTKTVITADEHMPLSEVAKLMVTQRLKCLPIVRGKSVIGIVSRLDLLKALLSRRPAASVFAAPPKAAPLSARELLHGAVTAALQGHSWSVAQRGDVVVRSGIAHLWGVVPSTEILEAYRVAAAKVAGVKSVEVHMHVLPSL